MRGFLSSEDIGSILKGGKVRTGRVPADHSPELEISIFHY